MMKSKIFAVGSLLLLLAQFAIGQTTNTSTLKVLVKNYESIEGTLFVAMYDAEQTFMEKECRGFSIAVTEKQTEFLLDSLAIGKRYALAIFQDLNSDGIMNVNMFGIPKEPYAFGHNAMGLFGPPSFFDASILIKPIDNLMVITLD